MCCTVQDFPWKWQELSVTVYPTRASVVWRIRDFSKIPAKTGDYLESQTFGFLNSTWSLQMYPNGDRESNTGEVQPYLHLVSPTNKCQKVNFKFFYRDRSTKEYHSTEHDDEFNNSSGIGPTSRIKIQNLLRGNLRELLLVEDTLTVCCEVRDPDAGEQEDASSEEILNHTMDALRKTVSDFKKKVQWQKNEIRCLHNKLANLSQRHSQLEGGGSEESLNNEQKVILDAVATVYEETIFPDVTLKVGGEDLPAHKAFLSGRSPVFRAMFQADMKESRERVADIKEMEVQTARKMLRYLYSGEMCDLEDESAKSLYVAADRYHLPGLKTSCLQYLLTNISADNVCQLALLADLHSDEELKSAVRLFLCKNYQRVIESAIWKESVAENPVFFVELTSSVLLNFVPKSSE